MRHRSRDADGTCGACHTRSALLLPRKPFKNPGDCLVDRRLHSLLVVDDAVKTTLCPPTPRPPIRTPVPQIHHQRASVVDLRAALIVETAAVDAIDVGSVKAL